MKSERHQLTYRELNGAANRVAHVILERRGHGEEPIALLLEHDAPAIAAICGVLKAGKLFVPLEGTHPQARLASTLDDSQAQLLVTDRRHRLLAEALARPGRQVLDVDELAGRGEAPNPDLRLPPDTLAGVMYTSGATGPPKGVLQNHRDMLQHVMRLTNSLHVCSEDRQTLLRRLGSSAGLLDLFSALLNGAAIFPLRLDEQGLAQLANWLISEEITLYRSAASLFRHFAGALRGDEEFPRLRLIQVGGEPAHQRDVELFKRHFSASCILVSGLGGTEFGPACRYFIRKATPLGDGPVPVGYPLEGVEILVLDATDRHLGPNETGEIAIRSRYLSRGYWRRPDLTRAAFLPDPAGGDLRIYRTGDLGRRRPDGCLELLGRKDFQVKVRGYRIEVAEIERALLDLDGVKETVVVAREDTPGDTRLVAYVVPSGQPGPALGELRRHLQARLPMYMLPSSFVLLESLPLASSGKVDRRALPESGRARPELERAYLAPRGPLEALLAAIWAEVLGLERVGVEDEFLVLGGDSLLVTRLVARVRDALQAELPLGPLLESATVAEQAAAILRSLADQVGREDLAAALAELEGLSDEQAGLRLRRAAP